jgi:hypothetical protein
MTPIIVNSFYKGMASSPYVTDGAVANSVNLDIFSYYGIARLNYKTTWQSTGGFAAFAGIPLWTVNDTVDSSILYVLDSTHYLGYSANSGLTWAGLAHGNDGGGQTPSAGVGNGMIAWKGYLVIVGNTTIDFKNLTSGTWYNKKVLTLTNSFQWHNCFVSKNDGNLYIADKNILHKISEVAGQAFDPTDAGTYSSTDYLTLPTDYQIRCIEERGVYLLCGTYKTNNNLDCAIFPWDRTSTTWNMPYFFPENGVQAMKNIGGMVYAIVGTSGKLYSVSESGYQYLDKLPFDWFGNNYINVYPDSMGVLKGNLCFGLSAGTGGLTIPKYGLYSWNGKFNLEHIISSGNTSNVIVGTFLPMGNNAGVIGWRDTDFATSNWGVDLISSNNKYTAYTGYFETLLYKVGTKYNPGNIKNVEIQLSKPLTSGDGIKIEYRRDVNSAYIEYETIAYATHGGITSFSCRNLIPTVENIQFKISFAEDAELLELRLLP